MTPIFKKIVATATQHCPYLYGITETGEVYMWDYFQSKGWIPLKNPTYPGPA